MERRTPPLSGHCQAGSCSNKRTWPQASSVLWRKDVQRHPQVSWQEHKWQTEGKTGANVDRAHQRLLRGWSSCPEGEAEGLGVVQSGEELLYGESWSNLPVPKGVRLVEPNFSLQCMARGQERKEGAETWEVQMSHNEKLFQRKFVPMEQSAKNCCEDFQHHLDKAQSNVLWPHDRPWFEQETELDTSTCPSQLESSYHCMTSQLRHLIFLKILRKK